MMTYSLFSSPDDASLEEKYARYFTEWIAHRCNSRSSARSRRSLNEDSAEVYQEMWNAFAAFCIGRSLDLHEIEAQHLLAFLNERGAVRQRRGSPPLAAREALSFRYARRFLTLIEWITTFQAKADDRVSNQPARVLLQKPEYKYANASHKDPLPNFLSEAQVKIVIGFITLGTRTALDATPEKWKVVRNRTAVALMLGGGLTPGDVRHLRITGVHIQGGETPGVPWKLSLPGNGNFPARETPLAGWAGSQLARWLQVREEQGLGGEFVLPGSRAGTQWSDTRCYETSREVLEQAGLKNLEGGVFRLRHTFALRQLAQGCDERDVARWLGLLDVNGMERYRRILTAAVDVV